MSPSHPKIANAPHRPPSILSLAPETMLGIFDYLLPNVKVSLWWAGDNISAVFPFFLAHVCRYWLDILSLKPSYWSNIAVSLHLPIIPSVLSTYSDLISRKDADYQCLIYCDSTSPLPSRTEHARIDTVMRALAPHLHKYQAISIRTRYRSSSVLVTRHLNGLDAGCLTYFSLFSSKTDTTEEARFTSFSCPKLRWLSMDGKTLLSFAQSEGKKGGEQGRPRVHVTPYRPPSGRSYLTPSALITALIALTKSSECMDELHVDNVSFDDEPTHSPVPRDVLDVISVEFTDLDGLFLREFFPRFEGGEGRIVRARRCAFDCPIYMHDVDIVWLEEIDDGASILCALRHWDGMSLSFKNCRGFNDAVLNMVTSEDWFSEIYDLHVEKCPVSAAALRAFAEARKGDEYNLEDLKVSRGPPLGDDDRKWFEDNFIGSFSWNKESIDESTW